ncbi:MAG: hypothetical protein GY842_23330, partial [bacterium]|nr:hypothetical protein [bacterium]
SFQYDDLDRLTYAHANGNVTSQGGYTREYEYDEIGNIDARKNDGVTVDYDYPPSGLNSVHPHAATTTGSSNSYSYDDNGNMSTRTENGETYNQVFNVENKLESVTVDGETTTFVYDGDGNRVLRTGPDGTLTAYIGGYYEVTEATIGEVGYIDDTLTHSPQTIVLDHSYVNPVVFAQPISFDGANTSVTRITNVQSDRFTLYVDEAPDHDGAHTTEAVGYLVLEAGSWQLADGTLLDVGTLNTNATVGKQVTNQWVHVDLNLPFSAAPVVVSQVQTNNDTHWVKTRQQNVVASGFDVALEEDDGQTAAHGSETVGWLAIEAGEGEWNDHNYKAANTSNAVTHNWYTINFGAGTFTQAPRFVAGLATYDGGDGSYLRYDRASLTASGVQLKVEEDTTQDSETNHTTEVVSYLAVQGDGTLTVQAITKYYYAAGQRVAMRRDGVVQYLHGDHLGSTSLSTDANGAVVARQLYYPYGEERWSSGTLTSDYGFTGQRRDVGI